jgi:hypothetical protein
MVVPILSANQAGGGRMMSPAVQQGPAGPLRRALRDLRLRVHRELTSQLARSGLWLEDDVYFEGLRVRRTHGKALADDLVASLLGHEDFVWLDGSNVFGDTKSPFRLRLPQILSFGYDLGLGMASSAVTDENAKLCALFNLGITMFDMISDRVPDGPRQLSRFIDPSALIALSREKKAARRLRRRAEALKHFELRCILSIVSGFFIEMQKRFEFVGDAASSQLEQLILRAYCAQMVCSNWKEDQSAASLLEAIREKSVLPFNIIHRIACLGGGTQAISEALASEIGEIFAQLDDLVDLSKDLRDGQVNSLLIECGANEGEPRSFATYEMALSLLGDRYGYVDGATKRLSLVLQKAVGRLDRSSGLGLSILIYTRGWLS